MPLSSFTMSILLLQTVGLASGAQLPNHFPRIMNVLWLQTTWLAGGATLLTLLTVGPGALYQVTKTLTKYP